MAARAAQGGGDAGRGGSKESMSGTLTGFTLHYPMWVMPLEAALQLEKLPPHGELRASGSVVEFLSGVMVAIFVSHQWVALKHPDPQMKQFRVLQQALRNVAGGQVTVQGDDMYQTVYKALLRMTQEQVERVRVAHIWYDWISCPQISARSASQDVSRELQAAVDSIPAYIHLADFFVVLAPTVAQCELTGKCCDYQSWSTRGWCRLELFAWIAAEGKPPVILVTGATSVHFTSSMGWLDNMPGEGVFTLESDRRRIRHVTENMLRWKLDLLEADGDLHAWRFFRAMRGRILRGLVELPAYDSVPEFLVDFKFKHPLDISPEGAGAGWSALHYAAISGGKVLAQLVGLRCDPNAGIRATYQAGMMIAGAPPIFMAACLGSSCSVRTLLQLRADPCHSDSEGHTVLMAHACRREADGGVLVDILQARGDVNQASKWPVSLTALHLAAMVGSRKVVAALLELKADSSAISVVGNALMASCFRNRADIVEELLERRMDPNFQWDTRGTGRWLLCMAARGASSIGAESLVLESLAMSDGCTPLIAAARVGSTQAVRLLLAARADCTARTSNGCTAVALALAQGHSDIAQLLRESAPAAAETRLGAGGGDGRLWACGRCSSKDAADAELVAVVRDCSKQASQWDEEPLKLVGLRKASL